MKQVVVDVNDIHKKRIAGEVSEAKSGDTALLCFQFPFHSPK